jgi:hypothetical protein
MSTETAILVVSCIGAVAAIAAAVVPLYLAKPRVRLRCVRIQATPESARISVQAHNQGHGTIHGLRLSAPFYGQSIEGAQFIANFDSLGPDEARTENFVPTAPARIEDNGDGLALLTPMVVVAEYGAMFGGCSPSMRGL